MSLRAYAAIKLCVPASGIDWLDGMIRKAQRNEFAGQTLAGLMGNPELQFEVIKAQIKKPGREKLTVGGCLAHHCFDLADAMADSLFDTTSNTTNQHEPVQQ